MNTKTESKEARAIKVGLIRASVPATFDWNETRDPNEEADNYVQGYVSGKLPEKAFGETFSKWQLDMLINDAEVTNDSKALAACEELIREITGDDRPFTRRDALIAFSGYSLHRIVSQLDKQVQANPLMALLSMMQDK